MKTIYLYFLTVLTLSNSLYSQGNFKLGVNLDDNGAFVNIINHTTGYIGAISYDSLGWSRSNFDLLLMDGRPVAEWSNSIDDPDKYRVDYSGRYKSSFKGWATVAGKWSTATIENKSYDSASNTTFFDVIVGDYPNANHGMVFLSFTNTRRTLSDTLNSGITNLKVFRPGYELNSTKIFTDKFLSLCKAADFDCYRFYNLQNIWGCEPVYPQKTSWDLRKTPSDASQESMAALNNKRDAWSWEYIIELSNILKKDIWINIPISCDSAYVSNLAKLLKEKLDSKLNIYVENSNEVWSPTQATHGPYNQAQANFYKINFDQNYARRSVELSKWFGLVYGQNEINKKIRIILAGQQAYLGRSDIHLNFIKNNFGDPRDFIYATSSSAYFGSTKSNSTDPLVINDGMTEDINSQISDSTRLNHIKKAASWGLIGGCTSYEGGPGVPSGGGTVNISNQILSHRTSKMKDIVKLNYLEGWKNIGGGLALYFTLSSGYNRYGCWGLTDDYTNPDRNSKMQGVREIIAGYTSIDMKNNLQNSHIFPNPSSDFIEILNENGINQEIEIYNSMGEVVSVQNIGNRIKISDFPAGMYFVKIGDKVEKFIKR